MNYVSAFFIRGEKEHTGKSNRRGEESKQDGETSH
jgi:hypothetical protein